MAKKAKIEEFNFTLESAKLAGLRSVRVLVAIIIAGIVSKYGNSDYFITLAPILNGLSKFIREEYGIDFKVI